MLKEIIILAVVVLLLILLFKAIEGIVVFVVNSVIGIFALIGFNHLFNSALPVNVWTILITTIGGIIGFTIIVVCHYLHIAF